MAQSLINHIHKFVDISEEEITPLSNYVKHLSISKKEILVKEEEICKHIYFVEKGCLRLFFTNEKGTEQITQFAIENWWLADYMSFDSQLPSKFTIQAIEASSILAIEHGQQELLVKELPQLETYFRLMLQKAYAALQFRIRFLYELSKEESYQHFVNRFPEFVQRIPQYMLASYLGFTPEYLSELRKKIR